MSSFAAQIDAWTKKTSERTLAVFRQSVQDLAQEVQTPQAMGGNMPVDTGFLRNSMGAAVNSYPRGTAAGGVAAAAFDMQPIVAAIMQANLGDRIVLGWTAEYAPYMEARYGFVRLAAQNWQQIVRQAVTKVRRDYGD